MATKGKAKKTKKQAKGQSGEAWPTMMSAVGGMDKQTTNLDFEPDRVPRQHRAKVKPIGITPKMPKLR